MQNTSKKTQQFTTCQTEQQDLAMLTEKLKPGTLGIKRNEYSDFNEGVEILQCV